MQCPITHQSINGECVQCDGLCPKGTMRVGGVNRCIREHGSVSLCRDGQKTKWRLQWKY